MPQSFFTCLFLPSRRLGRHGLTVMPGAQQKHASTFPSFCLGQVCYCPTGQNNHGRQSSKMSPSESHPCIAPYSWIHMAPVPCFWSTEYGIGGTVTHMISSEWFPANRLPVSRLALEFLPLALKKWAVMLGHMERNHEWPLDAESSLQLTASRKTDISPIIARNWILPTT